MWSSFSIFSPSVKHRPCKSSVFVHIVLPCACTFPRVSTSGCSISITLCYSIASSSAVFSHLYPALLHHVIFVFFLNLAAHCPIKPFQSICSALSAPSVTALVLSVVLVSSLCAVCPSLYLTSLPILSLSVFGLPLPPLSPAWPCWRVCPVALALCSP